MKKAIHKEPVNYSSFTSYWSICGIEGRFPKPIYVDKHYDWKKVTCKRCLKHRKLKK